MPFVSKKAKLNLSKDEQNKLVETVKARNESKSKVKKSRNTSFEAKMAEVLHVYKESRRSLF